MCKTLIHEKKYLIHVLNQRYSIMYGHIMGFGPHGTFWLSYGRLCHKENTMSHDREIRNNAKHCNASRLNQ